MTQTSKQIRWAKGYRPFGKVSAERAYTQIEKLTKTGGATAQSLLESSRSKEAPCHGLFDWDDNAAAEKYRLEQARGVLRSVEVIYQEKPDTPVKAFQLIKNESAGQPATSYVRTEDALADPVYRKQILARARAELSNFRDKYKNLDELSNVFREIDDLAA